MLYFWVTTKLNLFLQWGINVSALRGFWPRRESHFCHLQEYGKNIGPCDLTLQKAAVKHRYNQLQNIIFLFSNSYTGYQSLYHLQNKPAIYRNKGSNVNTIDCLAEETKRWQKRNKNFVTAENETRESLYFS